MSKWKGRHRLIVCSNVRKVTQESNGYNIVFGLVKGNIYDVCSFYNKHKNGEIWLI